MNTDKMAPQPMNENQLDYVKKEIIQTYLFLIGQTAMIQRFLSS
jgi:hypothetical protein